MNPLDLARALTQGLESARTLGRLAAAAERLAAAAERAAEAADDAVTMHWGSTNRRRLHERRERAESEHLPE